MFVSKINMDLNVFWDDLCSGPRKFLEIVFKSYVVLMGTSVRLSCFMYIVYFI